MVQHSFAAQWTVTAPPDSGRRQEFPRSLLPPNMADGSRFRPQANGVDTSAPSPSLHIPGSWQRVRSSPRQLTPTYCLQCQWRQTARSVPTALRPTPLITIFNLYTLSLILFVFKERKTSVFQICDMQTFWTYSLINWSFMLIRHCVI